MTPLRATAASHKPDSTLPLINIVLLLVLAFMIAGTVAAPLPEGFDPLQSMRGAPQPRGENRVDFTVTQSGDVQLNGSAASSKNLQAALEALAETGGKLSVKADSRAPASAVMELLADAETANIKEAVVVTIGSKP